ncbi:hypothetical protein PVAP13_5NG151100 [Panicum virgatum]|uniref:Uncharacterized protein n=1 Tax=Panicum virgatum TaxID=38727 RepID=A0A8T0RPS5_PANVG|nr:hypothetical protein PVAP13_5NG151100 [Panicum virgatum]
MWREYELPYPVAAVVPASGRRCALARGGYKRMGSREARRRPSAGGGGLAKVARGGVGEGANPVEAVDPVGRRAQIPVVEGRRRRARSWSGSRRRSSSLRRGSPTTGAAWRSAGEVAAEEEDSGRAQRRHRCPGGSPLRARKKARALKRTMDNSWYLCAGITYMEQGSNMPFCQMLNLPVATQSTPSGPQPVPPVSNDPSSGN